MFILEKEHQYFGQDEYEASIYAADLVSICNPPVAFPDTIRERARERRGETGSRSTPMIMVVGVTMSRSKAPASKE